MPVLRPVWSDDGGVHARVQYTTGTCRVCSDHSWSLYTESVFLERDPPKSLSELALPDEIVAAADERGVSVADIFGAFSLDEPPGW